MRLVGFILFVFCVSLGASAYYGQNSAEAILTFTGKADLPLDPKLTLYQINSPGSVREYALRVLNTQIQHLMGTLQSNTFMYNFGYPGSLSHTFDATFLSIDQSSPGRSLVTYNFQANIIIKKEAFHGRRDRNISLWMPLKPDQIYSETLSADGNNYCTDKDYNSEDDFWYFWDPGQNKCPLQQEVSGKKDLDNLVIVDGHLARTDVYRQSYPEYDKLFGDNGNGNAFDVYVYFGFIEDEHSLTDVDTSDPGYLAYKELERSLIELGFVASEKREKFRLTSSGSQIKGVNYFSTYEKSVKVTEIGRAVQARVHVLLSDTDIASKDFTFHTFLPYGIANADIMIYDGHSGLGGNFDLKRARLTQLSFNQEKYQIYFFNGCSSYTYFNNAFFEAKGGTQNLDIVSSGLQTDSAVTAANVATFLNSFLVGKTIGYPRILQNLEDSNGDNDTFMVGVSGDEDNRWTK